MGRAKINPIRSTVFEILGSEDGQCKVGIWDVYCFIITRRFAFFISKYQWMSPNSPEFARKTLYSDHVIDHEFQHYFNESIKDIRIL